MFCKGCLELGQDPTLLEPEFSRTLRQVSRVVRLPQHYYDDTLPALSAIAKSYRLATGDSYLAGIWQKDIHRGLLWSSIGLQTTLQPSTRDGRSRSRASLLQEALRFSGLPTVKTVFKPHDPRLYQRPTYTFVGLPGHRF
jgi:hypothetical protein